MSYRGANLRRQRQRLDEIREVAGHVLTWRQWVSASAADPARGRAAQDYYLEQAITGFVAFVNDPNEMQPVGQVTNQRARLTTDFPLIDSAHSQDDIIWEGVRYRVEGTSTPSRVAGQWTTELVRGNPLA